MPLTDLLHHFVDIVGNLRDQDDVRAAGNARIEGQPAHFMPHHFHDEYPPMGCRRSVNAVDGFRSDVHRALKSERHVGSP